MPNQSHISQYDLLSSQDIDLSQDLVLLNSYENSTFSSTSQDLLDKSTVKQQQKYFVKSVDLNIDTRSKSINISSRLDLDNLLHVNSEFFCQVNFICDLENSIGNYSGTFGYKILNLPSFSIRKNLGSTSLIVDNYQTSNETSAEGSYSTTLSYVCFNDVNYDIKSLISSGVDFIEFGNICYTPSARFKTKVNFIYSSLI